MSKWDIVFAAYLVFINVMSFVIIKYSVIPNESEQSFLEF